MLPPHHVLGRALGTQQDMQQDTDNAPRRLTQCGLTLLHSSLVVRVTDMRVCPGSVRKWDVFHPQASSRDT